MFASIICQKIDERKCLLIAVDGKEKMELEVQFPFFKTKKRIWKLIYTARKFFNKNGFEITGSQISSAISMEYPNIPSIYY